MERGKIKSFEELECWRTCTELRRFIIDILRGFPKEEKFALIDDMKRAARSTTHNIAEGYGRFHYKENIQFCRQSRGSLYELADQLITSLDEGLINAAQLQEGRALIDKSLSLLNGYIRYLSSQQARTGRKPQGGEVKSER